MPLLSNYRVRHKGCNGEISKRTCQKCGMKWGIMAHLTTLDYYSEKADRLRDRKFKERKLTGNPVTDALPYWPRWARLLSTAGVILIIAGVILYVF